MNGHQDRRAAIFGASGGIGSALVAVLTRRGTRVSAGSRSGADIGGGEGFAFDLTSEESIAAAVASWTDDPPQLVIVATGALTLPDGTEPEKSYRFLDADAMARAFELNTIGPALIAKHVLPLFPRSDRSIFAVLSARIGSIADNGIGGWHSYRASKAALNMLVRNLAIELGRTHPQAVVAALHPGTVDTGLSRPFQRNVPAGQLFSPDRSATALIEVIDGLQPADSGGLFAWDGQRIPY